MGIRKKGQVTRDWKKARELYLSGKCLTLTAVVKKTGISVSSVTKKAADEKWVAKRKEIEQKAQEKAEEKIVESYAQRVFKMRERHIGYAKIIQTKSLQYLRNNDVDNPATAINGLIKSAKLEQAALEGKTLKDDGDGGSIFTGDHTIINMRELTDEQLYVIASGGTLVDGATGSAGDTGKKKRKD
jgi:hypothetical protein